MKKAIFLLSLLLLLCSNIFSYTITVHYEACHDVQVKVGEDCHWECENEHVCWKVCTPIYETREECETRTQSYTIPESTSPEELQTAIVEATGDEDATYENVSETEGELDTGKSKAIEEISDLEELKTDLAKEVEQAKEDIKKKYNESLAQTCGDPVRTALGTFITSETDISNNGQLFDIQVDRRFDSANRASHSLGKGWTLNYDSRIIRGSKQNADILLQQAQTTYDNVTDILSESRSLYDNTLARVNNLVDALSDVLNTLNTTIINLENSYDSAPSRIKPRIQDDLENAISKKSEMTEKFDNAYVLKADLENNYAIIEELEIKQAYALSELERIKALKALSDTNNELNEYVYNSSDPEYYQYSGIDTLTLIDEKGTPTTFKIDTPPDYESTIQLSGDVTNYWPDGSSTTALSPTDDVLKLLPSGEYTVMKKDGTLYHYNFYGQLQSIKDRNENTIELSYSENGRLQSIIDEFGRKLTILMDSEKRIASITDPANNQVSYSYNGSGYLSSVTDLDDDTVQYTYYTTGEIEKIIKPDGSFRKYNYIEQNGRWLISSTVDEEGALEHFYYHFDEGYTEYVNPAGVSELHYYDERNRETKVVYADGSCIENTYDENNNLTSVRSRSGYITDYSYDENNNLIRIDYPDGSKETMEYNEWSQLTKKTDADGNRLVNEYDSMGNLISTRLYGVDGALESDETMSYTSQGLVSEKTRWNTGSAMSMTEYYSYDEYGNIAEVIDGEGHTWSYTFSVTGLLERIEDPLGNATEYEHTPSGRITKVSYPDGSSEETVYTNRKDIDYLIDRAGNRYEYTYNKRHNLISVENPLGESVHYTYDGAGKPLSKSIYSAANELTAHWQYEYDPYTGELFSQEQQLDESIFAETRYLYDDGLVWKVIDPAGTSTELSYDERDRVVSKTISAQDLEFPIREYFSYTGRGLLESHTDPRNNKTEYEYNAMGKITSVINPDQSSRQLEYDGAGSLLSFTDEEDYRTSYRYNASGQRTKTVYPDGSEEQWHYNEAGRLIAYTDRNETRFRYELDAMGRIITEKLPAPYTGAERSYTYNSRDQMLTYTDANGNTWSRSYDLLGNMIETVDPQGNTTSYEYTPLGQVSRIIKADESEWLRSYDMAGRLVSATDPLEAVTRYGYDARGNLLWEEDPLGRKDRYTWDSLGRLVSTRDGEDTGVDYCYDAIGNLVSETQTGGEPYRYFYDSRNRLSREVNRLGDERLYEYYRNGRLSEIRDFNGNATTFRYDEAARLSEKEFNGEDTETYTYDGLGNVLSAVNPSSELEYVYDPMGRLIKSIDHLKDQSISYGYDPAGNRTSLSWSDGNRTTGWSYNELNLPVAMTDAEGEVTRFSYDELGRETERILANGITRRTTYDEAGRISSIIHDEEWNNGHHHGYGRNSRLGGKLPSQVYAYNEAGQKILQVDELGRLTAWEYDNAGRLAEASYSFAGGKSEADFWERIYLGVIPEEIKKGHQNDHNRDEDWMNSRGKARESGSLTAELEDLAAQNPLLGEMGFSSSEYLERLDGSYLELAEVFPELKNHSLSAAARLKENFAFKANWGHLHKRLPEELNKWFSPGKIGELLEQPQWTEHFTYDLRGNITTKSNGWGEIAYIYNEENRLTKAGERDYTWDANGNLTGESLGALSASYSYDGENRLTEIISNNRGFLGSPGRPMDKGILYSYDSFGRRISREEITDLHSGRYRDRFASSGECISYLYDGLGFDVLAEGRDAAGRSRRGGWHGNSGRVFNPTSEYLMTNGSVIVRNDITGSGRSFLDFFHGGSPAKSYYTQDGLGSMIGIFNKNGNLEERYTYDSFGRLTEGRFDGENRLGYNGKRMDPYSGRYDYGFRDYDPMVMRWTTVDPVKDGSNWYAYVGNDPVNYVDPWGLEAGDTFLTQNAAARDWANTYFDDTTKQGREFASFIYKERESYSYTVPERGSRTSVDPGKPHENATAIIHSHPDDNRSEEGEMRFSYYDISNANSDKLDAYLLDKEGGLQVWEYGEPFDERFEDYVSNPDGSLFTASGNDVSDSYYTQVLFWRIYHSEGTENQTDEGLKNK